MNQLLRRGLYKLNYKCRVLQDYCFGRYIVKKNVHASPDFMIIGAAKCGTTSLFQYLAKHPQIIPPQKKELKYFGMGQQRYGLTKYLSNFPTKKEKKDKLTFEATPTYLYLKDVPRKVTRVFPRLKYIVILRDPVERAFSHWSFYKESSHVEKNKHLYDSRSFERAVYDEINNPEKVSWIHKYLERGIYVDQLSNWYNFVNPKDILLIDQKDLKETPNKTLGIVTNFLAIENIYSKYKVVGKKVEELKMKANEKDDGKIVQYNVNKNKGKIDEETRELLENYYSDYNKKLLKLTGKNFSWI